MPVLFALQGTEFWFAIVVAGALFAGLLIPFLFEEVWRGKVELGRGIPTGAGDIHPGYRGNPLPGQPDAQAGPHDANGML